VKLPDPQTAAAAANLTLPPTVLTILIARSKGLMVRTLISDRSRLLNACACTVKNRTMRSVARFQTSLRVLSQIANGLEILGQ